MKHISKRIIALILVFIMLFSAMPVTYITASAASKTPLNFGWPRGNITPPDPLYVGYRNPDWAGIKSQLLHGWHSSETVDMELYCFDNYTVPAFCIEYGTHINDNYNFSPYSNGNQILNKLAQINDVSDGPTIERYLCAVIGAGYHDTVSYNNRFTTWNSSTKRALMAKYIATQYLVWEVAVGERDENFNSLPIPSGCRSILGAMLKDSHPLRQDILNAYNAIVRNVKSGAVMPSFCSASKVSVDDTPYELGYSNGSYTLTIHDENGVIGNYTSIECDQGNFNGTLEWHVSNNDIIITSKNPIKELNFRVNFKYEKCDVQVWSGDLDIRQGEGNQDFVVANSSLYTATNTGYFTIKCPHIHVFIPHKVEPTCSTEGYTIWKCACGIVSSVDPHNGVDSHVPATGHDMNSPYIVSVPETCIEEGEYVQLCDRCNAPLAVKTIQAHGHDNGVWKVDVEATPDSSGKMTRYCTLCGDALETKTFSYHNHTFGHSEIVRQASCTESGLTGKFCSSCNACYETTVSEKLGHTDASESIWTTTTAPTCLAKGEETGYCARCGEKTGTRSIPALGHTTGTWITNVSATCAEDGESIRACDRCGEIIERKTITATGHGDGTWITTINPTCTEKGEKTRVCEKCGVSLETEKLPATGHDDGVWMVKTYATCTEKGEKVLYCTSCGKELDSEKINKKGHGEQTWITNVRATCTTDGEEILVCADCEAILDSRSITRLGHDSGVTVVSRPNGCTTPGEKITTCTRCGEVIKSESVPAEKHDDGVWKIDYAATVDHDGQRSLYCSKCGAVLRTEAFPYHTHTYGYEKTIIEPTCNSKGEAGIYCKICGEQFDSKELAALEHDYSDIYTNNNGTHSRKCSNCQYVDTCSCTFEASTLSATCTKAGTTKRTCSVCGYSYTVSNDVALGHDWAKWVDDKNNDTHTRTCNRCGIKETAVHIWTEWRLIEKNTSEWTATYQRKCDFCGAVQTSTVRMNEEPHAHTLEHFPAVAPLCTEDGNSEYYHCTDPDCDKYFSDAEGKIEIEKDSWFLPAHGHNYILKDVVPPKCTENGYEYHECTYDASHNYTIPLEKHGHNYILKYTVEPTCTEDGYEYWECTYDASHNYKVKIPAHGHNYVVKDHLDPTCLDDGYDYYECTYDASHNYKLDIPEHGHDYHLIPSKCYDPTPEFPGVNYYECSYDPAHHYSKPVYAVSSPDDHKQAEFDEETGIATITLDASADSEIIISKTPVPVDIVLVLDTSGSMANKISGSDESKMSSVKNVAKNFAQKVAANNPDSRIAIVTFASDAYLYTSDGKKIARRNAANYYSSAFLGLENAEKVNNLCNIIDSLSETGATRADYGMEIANGIISARDGEYASRKTALVFLTDGVPTTQNKFDSNVASNAIKSAKSIKTTYSTIIYSLGFATDKGDDMIKFMNRISSNYPDAQSMDDNKCKAVKDPHYYTYVSNEKVLEEIFEDIIDEITVPSVPFDDITIFDTVSKEFTMTTVQEQAFRNSVRSEYGEDAVVSVIRNDDGTTSITVSHLKPKEIKDGSGKVEKYYVSITFDVTANQLAAGRNYYNTNTDNAGIMIEGMLVDNFSSPRVTVPDDRNIVVFVLEGDVYSIAVANIGDEVKAPEVANAVWDMPEGFTVSGSYTEINGSLTTPERILKWVLDNGNRVVEETYKVGQKISVFTDTEADGWMFCGWNREVPFTMPDGNLTITALYESHTHTPKQISQYGTCTEGITYVYACPCGYTYTVKNEPCEHELTATIANVNGLSFARVTCANCSYCDEKYITYQAEYNEETIGENFHGNTGTNQIFDIKMYNNNDVSVQPDGTISINIPATPQMLIDENLRIYRINENGEHEDISFVKNPDSQTITMTVDHFSCYVLTASNLYEANKTYEMATCPFSTGHEYEFTTTAPTCVSEGRSAYVCKHCGESYGEQSIPSNGHNDADHDGYCDGCGQMTEARAHCKHLCHSDKWYAKILWFVIRIFCKIFGINQYCECGTRHY